MESLFAILVGILVSTGLYCFLQRSLVRLAIGVMLLSQAANLIIFISPGLKSSRPAIIPEGMKTLTGEYADPLPQAIVLTAIVIGFGFVAFLMALLIRVYKTVGTDDVEVLNKTDTGS
jgi:multicomponent Na+:H+ antiporter subunit C